MKMGEAIRNLHKENDEVPDNVIDLIPITKNHVSLRKWASENACTLIFLATMFGITWLILLLQGFGVIHAS